MAPKTDKSEFAIARAALVGDLGVVSSLCEQDGGQLWRIDKAAALLQSTKRPQLVGQAAARLLRLRAACPVLKTKLFLLCQPHAASASAARQQQQQQQQQEHLPLFDEDSCMVGRFGVRPTGYLSHSDASFNEAPSLVLARCGADKFEVTFSVEVAAPGESAFRLRADVKRAEMYQLDWQELPNGTGFTVQEDGTCLADVVLELDGQRRLLELDGFGRDKNYKTVSHKRVHDGTDRTIFSVRLPFGAEAGQRALVKRWAALDRQSAMVMVFELTEVWQVFLDGRVADQAMEPKHLQQWLTVCRLAPLLVLLPPQQFGLAASAASAAPLPLRLPSAALLGMQDGIAASQASGSLIAMLQPVEYGATLPVGMQDILPRTGATPDVVAGGLPQPQQQQQQQQLLAWAAAVGEIAGLQSAQSATEDAVDLVAEGVDFVQSTVTGHAMQLQHLHSTVVSLSIKMESLSWGMVGLYEEPEVSSGLPQGSFGKRARWLGNAAVGSVADVASTAPGGAMAAPQSAVTAAAAGAAPQVIQLPPLDAVKQQMLTLVLSSSQGNDSLAVARALCGIVGVRSIKGEVDFVRLANQGLYELEKEGRSRREGTKPSSSKPLWWRVDKA